MDPSCLTITSTMVTKWNYKFVREQLRGICEDGRYGWNLSESLCSRLQRECFDWWENRFTNDDDDDDDDDDEGDVFNDDDDEGEVIEKMNEEL